MPDTILFLDGVITAYRRNDGWIAHITGSPGQWDYSDRSPEEAAGKLLLTFPGAILQSIWRRG